ncbi:MAG: hypothetical protein A2022_11300 [Deltaproteobacteria bacterium GWF2_42_12]|nr:MAG: hypothetical protein A2067_08265 [Deltaproteobacteria bacterium GWB2_42_7]OGP37857.1 MAG: hypothetical protein A2090_00535 [Deltaproteobacteria bacterium GWD2_42_10]OGP48007.1 MAG: hypothetical protein A2022_11300 [Deltaproteobacteria bacterium GWF2_42_12]
MQWALTGLTGKEGLWMLSLQSYKRCSGTQFDPKVVEVFLDIFMQWVTGNRCPNPDLENQIGI